MPKEGGKNEVRRIIGEEKLKPKYRKPEEAEGRRLVHILRERSGRLKN